MKLATIFQVQYTHNRVHIETCKRVFVLYFDILYAY